MQKPDADRGSKPIASWLDRLDTLGALENMLRRFKQAAPRHFDGEPTRPSKSLNYPRCAHSAQERLIRETRETRTTIPVKDILASSNLIPIYLRTDQKT